MKVDYNTKLIINILSICYFVSDLVISKNEDTILHLAVVKKCTYNSIDSKLRIFKISK